MILHRHDDPKLDSLISAFDDEEGLVSIEILGYEVRGIYGDGETAIGQSIFLQAKPDTPWFNLIEYIKEKYPEVFL